MTATGQTLMRIYTDMDLVAAECLRHGLWDDLTPAELAAALSALVFETRVADDADAPAAARAARSARSSRDMVASVGRPGRAGDASTGWTSCASPTSGSPGRRTAGRRAPPLDEVLTETDLAAGDFVRWMKQLLDLTGQVADAAGDAALRRDRPRHARRAAPRSGGLLVARRLTLPTGATAEKGQSSNATGGRADRSMRSWKTSGRP